MIRERRYERGPKSFTLTSNVSNLRVLDESSFFFKQLRFVLVIHFEVLHEVQCQLSCDGFMMLRS